MLFVNIIIDNNMEYNNKNNNIGDTYAHCTLCAVDFTIHHGGCNDITHHVKSTLKWPRLCHPCDQSLLTTSRK